MSHLTRRRLLAGFASLGAMSVAGPVFAATAPTPEAAQGFRNRYGVGLKPTFAQRRVLEGQAMRLRTALAGTGAVVFFGDSFTVATLPETALFAHPGTDVRPDAMPLINALAAEMLHEDTTWLEVAGHWHSDGNAAGAMTMSERRAVSVQAGLMSRGVPINRIVASGLGESLPVADNLSALGRRENRRIDLVFRTI